VIASLPWLQAPLEPLHDRQQLAAILLATGMFGLVVELVRRRKLREEYAWVWLAVALVLLALALNDSFLFTLSRWIGSATSTSTLFFGTLVFLLLLSLQFSVRAAPGPARARARARAAPEARARRQRRVAGAAAGRRRHAGRAPAGGRAGVTADGPALARGVAVEFRRRLQGEYVPRIGRCVELLGDEALWRRPAAHCNSVGNLLLHLGGNVAQWILTGLGGAPDHRDRPAEFAADGGMPGRELLQRLRAVVDQACDTVDRLPPAELLRERTIQGRFRETGLAAVLHVMEHFSGHAGQIDAWTKQVTGRDLRFYDL
jgi:uncharacterized damage-inducible protein DinB